jgi:aminoglycoside phosphotransferase (APT) family kinase protein
MKLPDFPSVAIDDLHAVGQRHGLDAHRSWERLPESGIFNQVYIMGGQYVLRIPRDHPAYIEALYREAVAVPAARRAGVRTPALLVFEDTCDVLPVPYAIYERVGGHALESLGLEPQQAAEVWRELGRDLARVHAVDASDLASTLPKQEILPDPRELVETRCTDGWFTSHEARWFCAWLERLAPLIEPAVRSRLLHGDSQASNVMVNGDPLTYLAVIDWGAAALGDVADDFAGVPLRAVPFMLSGHRELAALDEDDRAEARILWRHLQLGLFMLPRGAVPRRSWAERPVAMLLEILRFFLAEPGARWKPLAP